MCACLKIKTNPTLIITFLVSCALVSKCLEKMATQYMSHLIQWEVEKACTAHLHHFSTFYGLAPPLLHNTYTLLYIYIIFIIVMVSYLVEHNCTIFLCSLDVRNMNNKDYRVG